MMQLICFIIIENVYSKGETAVFQKVSGYLL